MIDGDQDYENQRRAWALEYTLSFQPSISTQKAQDGWNTESLSDSSNQISLTFEPDERNPYKLLDATLSIATNPKFTTSNSLL